MGGGVATSSPDTPTMITSTCSGVQRVQRCVGVSSTMYVYMDAGRVHVSYAK